MPIKKPRAKITNNTYSLFKKAARCCPAYQDFLKKNKIDPNLIRKKDFVKIPLTDKNNYLYKYTLKEKILSNQEIADFYMVCTSSGSSDKPTIWLRDLLKDESAEFAHSKFLNDNFNVFNRKTLIIISFGMGTATAGMMHARLSWELSRKEKVTVITPDVDVEKTAWLIESLYKYYDQVICIGYPPLIGKVIDNALKKRFSVKKWNLNIAFAGGSVSALWRKSIADKISKDRDLTKVVGFYGCSEAGILGFETPQINKIINYCIKDKKLRFELFGSDNLPTIVELGIPGKFVEILNDELILTIDQPVPLIRYNVYDKASFLNINKVKSILEKREIKLVNKTPQKHWLVVFGRKEKNIFSIEDIRNSLEITNLPWLIKDEFQYKELKKRGKIILSLRLYYKKDKSIRNQDRKKIEKILFQKLRKRSSSLELKLSIVNEKKKIGFQSGKLRYFL